MKVLVDSEGTIILSEIYNPIGLSPSGTDTIYIFERDGTLEISVPAGIYTLVGGDLAPLPDFYNEE